MDALTAACHCDVGARGACLHLEPTQVGVGNSVATTDRSVVIGTGLTANANWLVILVDVAHSARWTTMVRANRSFEAVAFISYSSVSARIACLFL